MHENAKAVILFPSLLHLWFFLIFAAQSRSVTPCFLERASLSPRRESSFLLKRSERMASPSQLLTWIRKARAFLRASAASFLLRTYLLQRLAQHLAVAMMQSC